MDATLLASLTRGYMNATAATGAQISFMTDWYKIYGAGVILYHAQDNASMGAYRATVDGANWGTYPQKGYNQPDSGELSARAWIDANTPITLTPVSIAGGSTTTNTVINAPNITTNMVLAAAAIILILGYIIWPRRKTVFDRRRN
jgi:hypothetical protein